MLILLLPIQLKMKFDWSMQLQELNGKIEPHCREWSMYSQDLTCTPSELVNFFEVLSYEPCIVLTESGL